MTSSSPQQRPPPPAGIVVSGLHKTYGNGNSAVIALRDVQLRVEPGEVVGLVGPSGSGKSTLLKCLGAVLTPSGGQIELGGQVVFDGDHWLHPDLTRLRREQIGFIFQSPYLLPFLSVRDNVALLAMLLGRSNQEARAAADQLLADLDMAHRADAMPNRLSGGEQQRVAIARALVNRPPILLADEPTAPLDSPRAMAVMDLLERLAGQMGTSVIVVTHDEKILPRLQRIYAVRDGVVGEGRRERVRDAPLRFLSRRLRKT
ncbi:MULTISPECIES: ABC transporter ATP-binding protein [unclassified Cyanobium]|uniref:ABC transporter ATP-binding protein n=1 Tax=unclassified Cyanobium TaxID=2627006 RepID=UPI0020CE8309|nr:MULTISPECIES: ABC transporter ATP-binding protein [unclassified Cyanobium]MCP9832766.1 ABC transporter ATP-binding protein [Cyanobium sp. La Preciosa 7G6]MCP9935517.1 ABC transporter ATP-binding protein [Cyanobium sp. Aljojuca 7A6]